MWLCLALCQEEKATYAALDGLLGQERPEAAARVDKEPLSDRERERERDRDRESRDARDV